MLTKQGQQRVSRHAMSRTEKELRYYDKEVKAYAKECRIAKRENRQPRVLPPQRHFFCAVCRGVEQKCIICKNPQRQRDLFPECVEHTKYVKRTWHKLERFRTLTTGDDSLDDECIRLYGQWLTLTDIEWLFAVCNRLCELYTCKMREAIIIVEANQAQLQLKRRMGGLNGLIAKLAIDHDLKPRDQKSELLEGFAYREQPV